MKHRIRKLTSLLLSLSLISALTLPAAASNALGEDLSAKDTLLHQETQLSTNVFWSTTYSDLRTENLITYTPNKAVTPIVTYGDALTDRSSVADTAALLEDDGYRVVAGINGDFYNVSTGLPIGMVVTEGLLRSSDAGYYAIGFRADSSAILGKPGVKVSANLGYAVDDGFGNSTELVRPVAAVNKARTNSGLYLYTYDFNAKHTTGTTEPGINVVCTVEQGMLAIGSTVTLRVNRVEETTVTDLEPDQIVLSANLQADSYYTTALQNIPQGSELTLTVSANDGWEDVEYAIGALYCLAENGAVVPNLAAGSNPRTAVGQKADGTLIFYTIDGRKTGHSIGASLTQVGERLLELGCQTVLCLDGGGSTNLAVTTPDSTTATIINRPSETGRKVTNQVFLVASDRASGDLDHFYVHAAGDYVLAGSAVSVTASGVDSSYIPMNASYTLSASAGSIAEQEDGRSVIVKQADKLLRSSGRPLDLYRNKIEAETLMLEARLAPKFIPEVYHYDETMAALSMEDISAYKNLRKELAAGRVYGHLSENLSDFLAQSLLPTTDLVMDRQEKKKQVKFFTNPELCDITEDLVLTEPYLAQPMNPRNKNIVTPGNEDFVREHLYEDEALHAEVAALRNGFMNNAQALIHGDLHSGSIFANEQGIKVIDPEFASILISVGFGFAFTAKYSRNPGFQEKASFTAFAFSRIPFSS